MAGILDPTYDVLKELGSGGNGVVYLAQHKRLNRLVVIKADKRHLSAAPRAVEQEKEILKNLSNSYIPHLYDFFQDQEKDTAYTVMEYIEGESLNHPLKRNGHFSQAQVIKWSRQLLEALDYLHTRKPHAYVHGDVKPSNLMLTPDGDIRLIDFNISLALDGNNAVVGYTEGYASPEHYRLSLDPEDPRTQLLHPETPAPGTMDASGTLPFQRSESSGFSASSVPYEFPLDERSDIYSAGATMYHLLSGHRPAKRAEDVTPLRSDMASPPISPPLVAIIRKAMAPNPADRYQTAKEMLRDLEEVRWKDPAYQLWRRLRIAAAALVALIFLTGSVMAFVGLKQAALQREWEKLALESAAALREGDIDGAVFDALSALPESKGLLSPPSAPEARRALANALGVYDMTEGYQAYKRVSLPSESRRVRFSPDGSRIAVLLEKQLLIYDTESGLQTAGPFAADASILSNMVFSGNDVLIYAGEGALSACDLQRGEPLWTAKNEATQIALSGDGTVLAAVYQDENLATVYDARTGEARRIVDFDGRRPNVATGNLASLMLSDPGGYLFALNESGEWLAVSFQGGGLGLFNLLEPQRSQTLLETSAYERFEGGFSGSFFAWSGAGNQGSEFSVFNLNTMEAVNRVTSGAPFHVQADANGISVSNLQPDGDSLRAYAENTLTRLRPAWWNGTEEARIDGSIASFVRTGSRVLILTSDQRCLAFDAAGRLLTEYQSGVRIDFADLAGQYLLTANTDAPFLYIRKYQNHAAAKLFSYDPSFVHTDARVTADSSTAMLIRFNWMRLLSRSGEILADVEIPDAADVYSEYYWKDRDVLEVRYQDGKLLTYSTRNGALVKETQGEAPDGSKSGTYVTDDFIVETPFRGSATVQERDSGALIALETDGTLYDAVQVGDFLVAFFRTADLECYGLLLEDGKVVADLPHLSDVLPNGTLIFDDPKGGLYQSRIYSLEELLALAKQ